jgi:uncharacterized glyoxalase superfamily protein PhnB
MSRLKSAVPTFLVSDVGAAAEWYARELGFRPFFVPDREPYAFACLCRDGVELMLLRLPGYQKPDLTSLRPDGLWDAYIRTEAVQELYETVRDKPYIRMPLTRQSYGDTEFEVLDPNGYILVFGG